MKIITLLLLTAFLAGCSPIRQIEDATLVMSIKKLPCMGDCPVFSLKIYNNRIVVYEGLKFVDLSGRYTTKLTHKQFQNIKSSFLEAGFFDFKNVYSAHIMDMQTTYIYFRHGGKEKKILDYHKAPDSIKDLEKMLEALIKSEKWRMVRK